MDRMSARFIGIKLGKATAEIYDMWRKMGLVTKDKLGDWTLTELGRNIGGKMSKSNYLAVPTFEYDSVVRMMEEFQKNIS